MKGAFIFTCLFAFLPHLELPAPFFAPPDLKTIVNRMVDRANLFPHEKVFIHVDRHQKFKGETIWFKLYVINAVTHLPSKMSQIAYVDLIDPDGNVLSSRNIKITDGCGAGDFELMPLSKTGRYTLRGYTAYMKNYDPSFFYHSEIDVFDTSGKFQPDGDAQNDETFTSPASGMTLDNVSFYPEGGQMIQEIETRVGVKLRGHILDWENTTGRIKDSSDRIVANIQMTRFGLGLFEFTPLSGQQYRAEFDVGSRRFWFDVPPAQATGYHLSVHKATRKKFIIHASTTSPDGMNGSFIIAQLRGLPIWSAESNTPQSEFIIPLSTDSLTEGICQITLFSPGGEPVCERLIYIENQDDQVSLNVTTDKSVYGPRERVELDVALNTSILADYDTHLSVSVVDESMRGSRMASDNIRAYFLFTSELGRALGPSERTILHSIEKIEEHADLLLMTFGWRRFTWQSILKNEPVALEFLPEQGFNLGGKTLASGRDKERKSRVFLSAFNNDGYRMADVLTNNEGRFDFQDLQFEDTTSIVLQAEVFNEKRANRKRKKKSRNIGPSGNRNIDIVLDENEPPGTSYMTEGPPKIKSFDYYATVTDQYEDMGVYVTDFAAKEAMNIELPELLIQATKKKKEPPELASMFYTNPDNRIIVDSLPFKVAGMNVFDLIRQLPGVTVVGNGVNRNAYIRGISTISGSPYARYMLNGVFVDSALINSLSIHDIAVIDLFKGPSAAIFGVRGGNGVIAIYTRIGGSPFSAPEPRGIVSMRHPGYYIAKEFYSPDYSTPPAVIESDYRATLYWDDDVFLTSSGRENLMFYTSDKSGTYTVVTQGLTTDGRPVQHEFTFRVR